MSILAGIYYFDSGPVSGHDSDALLAGFRGARGTIELHRMSGLLMGQASEANHASPQQNFCTFDGRVDNRTELQPAQAGGAALALELYETDGPEGLGRLIGDWSLAIWDAREHAILLGSDYAGIRPLYYHCNAERVVWSSSLTHIGRWAAASELDEDYAAEFLAYGRAAGLSPYRGVYPVPPGSVLRVAEGRTVTTRFWSPPVSGTTEYTRETEYEDHFRALFQEAVAARLDLPGPACAELSGGLDSSSIVCVADRLISSGSVPATSLSTFTYCFPGSPDEKFYSAVENTCQASPVHLKTEDYPPLSMGISGGAMPALWAPRWTEVARRMTALGSRIFLTGQAGDLIMGNYSDDAEQAADYVRRRQFSKAIAEAFDWSHSLRVPVYSILRRALSASSAANTDVSTSVIDQRLHGDSLARHLRGRIDARQQQQAERDWLRQALPTRRKRIEPLRHLLEGRAFQCPEALEHVHCSHPYLHRPLVEFMLTIPPAVTCRPGEPRRLMRRALRGLVPDLILNRRSKGGYGGVFLDAERPCAVDLLRDPGSMRLAQLGFVDAASVATRLRRLVEALDCNEPQLRQLILLEFWLRHREGARTLESRQSLVREA